MPTVLLNGEQLFYRDEGPREAPPILFMHSLFFDHRMFEHQVEHFSPHYRVVAYDHRGHGATPHPSDGRYDMDTLTMDAAALIDALDLGAVHAVGNSMGGFVALRLGARYPGLVRSVAAVGSSADREHKAEEYLPLLDILAAGGGTPVVDVLMHTMFGDTTLAAPDQASMCRTWRERIASLTPAIAAPAAAVVARGAVLDELVKVASPVLAIAGAEDHAYSVALSEQIAVTAPRGKCVVIAQAGHSACLESAEEINRHLELHFEAADKASPALKQKRAVAHGRWVSS